MATTSQLVITDKNNQTVRMYLNDQDEIFLEELDDEKDCYAFWINLDRDDWQAMKEFIDAQFGLDQ